MNETEIVKTLEALQDAFKVGRPKTQAWYSFLIPTKRPAVGYLPLVAALAIGQEGDPASVAETVGQRFDALTAETGMGHHQGQWVDAALGLTFDYDPAVLAARQKDKHLTRQEALVLTALGAQSVESKAVRAMYKAVSPWMVKGIPGLGVRLQIYAAIHTMAGKAPDAVKTAQDQAKAAFKASDAEVKKAADAGARACVALGVDPREAINRYKALRRAQGNDSGMRKIPREIVMEWAVEGFDTTRFGELRRLITATAKVKHLSAVSRIRLASLMFGLANRQRNSHMSLIEQVAILSNAMSISSILDASSDGGGGDAGDGGGGE